MQERNEAGRLATEIMTLLSFKKETATVKDFMKVIDTAIASVAEKARIENGPCFCCREECNEDGCECKAIRQGQHGFTSWP